MQLDTEDTHPEGERGPQRQCEVWEQGDRILCGSGKPTPTGLWCGDVLTIRNLIWPLPLLIHNNDHHKDDDFSQNSQERPEWGQVAPYPEDGDDGGGADGVGGITFVLARVFRDLQVRDTQLRVIFLVDDEEAARGVDKILHRRGGKRGQSR